MEDTNDENTKPKKVFKKGNITVEEIGPGLYRATSVNSKYIVEYDKNQCIGAASCAVIAPLTFVMNDENRAEINTESEDFDSDDDILMGAQSCPVFAIKIFDKETGEMIFPVE